MCMTKLRVPALCFPYFTDNSIGLHLIGTLLPWGITFLHSSTMPLTRGCCMSYFHLSPLKLTWTSPDSMLFGPWIAFWSHSTWPKNRTKLKYWISLASSIFLNNHFWLNRGLGVNHESGDFSIFHDNPNF